MSTSKTSTQADQLADELRTCRQRGLDHLDLDTPLQSPAKAEQLERLARAYCHRTAPQLYGRIACIKKLLRDALAAYSARGNQTNADLITALFFGDPTASTASSSGELLKLAMKKRGVSDEKKFREQRSHTISKFAEFLLVFTRESDLPRRRRTTVVAALGFALLAVLGIATWLSVRDYASNPLSGASGPRLTTPNSVVVPPAQITVGPTANSAAPLPVQTTLNAVPSMPQVKPPTRKTSTSPPRQVAPNRTALQGIPSNQNPNSNTTNDTHDYTVNNSHNYTNNGVDTGGGNINNSIVGNGNANNSGNTYDTHNSYNR